MDLHREDVLDDHSEETPNPVSSAAAVAGWSDYSWQESVAVNHLSAFDRLVVATHNHVYEIIVVSPETSAVLVRGGAFPTFVRANVVGSRHHGTLDLNHVAVGRNLELSTPEGCWVVTTAIETLALVPASASYSATTTGQQ